MITDDDVMRLFEEADPARVHADNAASRRRWLPRRPATRSTDMTLTEISSTTDTTPRAPRGCITLAAVILVAVLIAGGAIALGREEQYTRFVTNPPPVRRPCRSQPTSSRPTTAYDADRVASFLAADADVSAMWNGRRLAARAPLHESHRPEFRSSAPATKSARTSLADRGALPRSRTTHSVRTSWVWAHMTPSGIDLTIHDGKIVDATMNFRSRGKRSRSGGTRSRPGLRRTSPTTPR